MTLCEGAVGRTSKTSLIALVISSIHLQKSIGCSTYWQKPQRDYAIVVLHAQNQRSSNIPETQRLQPLTEDFSRLYPPPSASLRPLCE